MSQDGHDDIAARLRREAAATAPERLRADVMVRVHAEPRPQRIRPQRSFRRSFASVAAAACVLAALVFGISRVDLGGGSSSSGGAGATAAHAAAGAGGGVVSKAPEALRMEDGVGKAVRTFRAAAVPGPLRAAITGRARLAAPLRHTFGALDPYHLRSGR